MALKTWPMKEVIAAFYLLMLLHVGVLLDIWPTK